MASSSSPAANVVPIRPPPAANVVLLVEDEPPVRAIIIDLLGRLGYKMLVAKDGPSGLVVLQATLQIAIVIIDVGIPGMNGRQLANAVRRTRKVLFLTNYAEGALIDKGILEKRMQIMTRPFAVNVLAAGVQGMLGGYDALRAYVTEHAPKNR